jgi:chromosome segregation ATPase
MIWRKLDQSGLDGLDWGKIDPPGDAPAAAVAVDFKLTQSSSEDDKAAVALELISETAAAIRQLEEQASQAVSRARSIVDATVEKLDVANARAERAERAQRKAEAEAADLSAALATARNEIETLYARLAATETELTTAQHRADDAEWRADDAERRAAEANAAIERIVNSIREQLPAGVGSATSIAQKKKS